MPSENIEIRIATDGEKDFRRISNEFGEAANGKLQRELRKNLYATAMPILNDLKAAVMAVEVTSSKGGMAPPSYSRQLRRRVAAALRVTIAYGGVRFGAADSQIGPYGAALAKYLDAEIPRYQNWRHPVFGKDIWVVQHGSPWFFETIRRHTDDFEAACFKAISETLRDLAR